MSEPIRNVLHFAAPTAGRADRAIAAHCPGVGRRRIAEWFERGSVLIDGKRASKGDIVKPGQIIEVRDEVAAPVLAAATVGDLQVIYEDDALIAVCKPSGMHTLPLRHEHTDTLANHIAARYPDCAHASPDLREAGLIHRLDQGTSGVLVAARNADVWARMRALIRDSLVEKTYLAVIEGVFQRAGQSENAIEQRGRRSVVSASGLPAHTRWEPLERGSNCTFVRCYAHTGRRHQIRVHLAYSLGPILGDTLYGASPLPDHPGFLLHAESLAFTHPISGKRVLISADWPASYAQLLARLRTGDVQSQ